MDNSNQAFLTQHQENQQQTQKNQSPYKLYDYIFPADNINNHQLKLKSILSQLKLTEGYPVLIISGAMITKHNINMENSIGRGRFYSGVARVCQKLDAVIIDSAIENGIEEFAFRRQLKLIGVAPQNFVNFPKINPSNEDPYKLANDNDNHNLQWEDISPFKFQLADRISRCSDQQSKFPNKIVLLLLNDQNNEEMAINELALAIENDYPVIVCKGNPFCNSIIAYLKQEGDLDNENLKELLSKGHIYPFDSINSEEIASYLHLFLTITPYDPYYIRPSIVPDEEETKEIFSKQASMQRIISQHSLHSQNQQEEQKESQVQENMLYDSNLVNYGENQNKNQSQQKSIQQQQNQQDKSQSKLGKFVENQINAYNKQQKQEQEVINLSQTENLNISQIQSNINMSQNLANQEQIDENLNQENN